LFEAAFGSAEITADRMSRALAQFVRAMVSGRSRFDQAFTQGGPPNFAATFTAQELLGQQLYDGRAGCARCHGTVAHIAPAAINNGLDAVVVDQGAGQGRFKAPSLRNVAVRGRFMHDGRFASLEEVIEFYNSGVQNNPGLDQRLRGPGGQPLRLNLTVQEKAALAAFLRTLTDTQFLTDVRFSNPFIGQ
jgi:cytochrome c peroxidase